MKISVIPKLKSDRIRLFINYPMIRLTVGLIVLFAATVASVSHSINRHYEVWCTGNCDTDLTNAETQPGAVLMGGGVSFAVSILVECCFIAII